MEAITSQVQDLYANANEEGRRKLQDDLRELQTSLDTEWDMVVRLGSGVSTPQTLSFSQFLLINVDEVSSNGAG